MDEDKNGNKDQNGNATVVNNEDINHNEEGSAAPGTMEDETSQHQHEGDNTMNNDDDDDDMEADVGDTSMMSFNDAVDTLPALCGPEVKRRLVWTRMKGFPWWPCLVMDTELEAALPIHIRKIKKGKDVLACYHYGPDHDVFYYNPGDSSSFREFEDLKDEMEAKKSKTKTKGWALAFEQSQSPDALHLFDHRWDPKKIVVKVPASSKKSKKPKSERRASTGASKKHKDAEEETEDQIGGSGNDRRASEPPKLRRGRKSRETDDVFDDIAEPPKKKRKSEPKGEEESAQEPVKDTEEEEHDKMMKLRAKLQKFWQKIDKIEPLDDKDIGKADTALKLVETFHEDGRLPAATLIKNTKIGKVIRYLSKCKGKLKEDKNDIIGRSARLMEKWSLVYSNETEKGKNVSTNGKEDVKEDGID